MRQTHGFPEDKLEGITMKFFLFNLGVSLTVIPSFSLEDFLPQKYLRMEDKFKSWTRSITTVRPSTSLFLGNLELNFRKCYTKWEFKYGWSLFSWIIGKLVIFAKNYFFRIFLEIQNSFNQNFSLPVNIERDLF